MKFGQNIKAARKKSGFTQNALSKKLQVDITTISGWERDVYLPRLEALLKMSKLFRMSLDQIIFGIDKMHNNEAKDLELKKLINHICLLSPEHIHILKINLKILLENQRLTILQGNKTKKVYR